VAFSYKTNTDFSSRNILRSQFILIGSSDRGLKEKTKSIMELQQPHSELMLRFTLKNDKAIINFASFLGSNLQIDLPQNSKMNVSKNAKY
jgi:hypothetical protein